MNLIFRRLDPHAGGERLAAAVRLLHDAKLLLEQDCETLIVADDRGDIVGCGAIAGNVLKCIAVAPQRHGDGLSLRLLTELVTLAFEQGRSELFLFTRPENVPLFTGAGFWPLAQADGLAVLMENSRERLMRYCRQLMLYRQPGKKIGAIVLNANPFTRGHQWLITQAARQCDWLHLFVVKEDASFFSYQDRYALIQQGIADIPRVILHPGSRYLISRATFPGYFLKEKGVVDDCHSQIDLMLFRQHLAPSLGITHRFVGSEPFCPLTRAYNQRMKTVLASPSVAGLPIEVVELARIERDGEAISASRIRTLYSQRNWQAIAALVPPTTLAFLKRQAAQVGETV